MVGDFTEIKNKKIGIKSMIAQKCAKLIKQNSCVFVVSGTMNLAVAESIPATVASNVVTTSPQIATTLLKKPQCEVISKRTPRAVLTRMCYSVGGVMRHGSSSLT